MSCDQCPDGSGNSAPGGGHVPRPASEGTRLPAIARTRRRFVDWLLGTSIGALVVSAIYPVSRYIVPPAAAESATASVKVGVAPEDVVPNSGQIFKFGSRPGILLRTPEGELRAFSAVCTHLGCTVQYRSDLQHIWCACHNGHFDLHGRNIAGPPPSPLEEYTANVQGDQVIVSKRSS